ncbi:hypothetical protein BDW68DRAFT_22438 [Aspergillus falconensis]
MSYPRRLRYISIPSSFDFLLSAACFIVICQFSALHCSGCYCSVFLLSKELDLIFDFFLTFDLKFHVLCSRCSALYYK